nr:MAG TPA: hypothetical protein [Caudoviricetes sp.]
MEPKGSVSRIWKWRSLVGGFLFCLGGDYYSKTKEICTDKVYGRYFLLQ